MRRHLRRHGDRGAAAVEFALVVPLFCLLVFGMADVARAINIQMTLSDAAAEGARTLATGSTAAAADLAVTAVLEPTLVKRADIVYTTTTVCTATAVPGSTRASMTVATKNFRFITPLIGERLGSPTIRGTAARQCAN